MMVSYLSVSEVIGIHQLLMDRAQQQALLRDEGGLESAVLRPQMAAYYGQASLIEQAAELIVGIALTHAFVDGNKRAALVAGETFLLMNNVAVIYAPLEFARQIEAIVNREDDLDSATGRLVEWLQLHTRAFS